MIERAVCGPDWVRVVLAQNVCFFSQTRLSAAEKGPHGTDATVTLTSGVIVVSAVDRCPVDHAVYLGP